MLKEIVECKDCIYCVKHRTHKNHNLMYFCQILGEKAEFPYKVSPNHYCSFGKKLCQEDPIIKNGDAEWEEFNRRLAYKTEKIDCLVCSNCKCKIRAVKGFWFNFCPQCGNPIKNKRIPKEPKELRVEKMGL